MISARDHVACAQMLSLTEVGSTTFLEHFVFSIISLNNIKRSFVDLLRKIVLGNVQSLCCQAKQRLARDVLS